MSDSNALPSSWPSPRTDPPDDDPEGIEAASEAEDESIEDIIAVDDAERVRQLIDREIAAMRDYVSWAREDIRQGHAHGAAADARKAANCAHRIMLLRVLLSLVETTGSAGVVIEDGKVKA